jgi:alpha-1,6-mannosyltransferase
MTPRSDLRRTAALALLAAALLCAVWVVHDLGALDRHRSAYVALSGAMVIVCGLAALLLWRRARRVDVAIVLAVAVVARALLAFDTPSLSNDSYRFVWDGRVQAAGINPYRYAPADRRLRPLRDFPIFTRVNRPYTRTLYPPTNEVAFLAIHESVGESLTGLKLVFLALEGVTVALLLMLLARTGSSPGRVALYAWHPLAVVETAASGHPDQLLLVFTLAAVLLWGERRRLGAGVALGVAVLTKVVPLVLAPWMLRRLGARFAAALGATVVLLYLPYAGAGTSALGSVSEFARESYGAGPHRWLVGLGVGDTLATVVLGGALAGFALVAAIRPPCDLAQACRYTALLLGGALLAAHDVQPWYLLWVLPFLCVVPVPALLWVAGTVSVYYLVYRIYGPAGYQRHSALGNDAASAIVWAPAVVLLAGGAIRSRFPRAPAAARARAPAPARKEPAAPARSAAP